MKHFEVLKIMIMQLSDKLKLMLFCLATVTSPVISADDSRQIPQTNFATQLAFYTSASTHAHFWANKTPSGKLALSKSRPKGTYILKRGNDELHVFRSQNRDIKQFFPQQIRLKTKSLSVGGIRIGSLTKKDLLSRFGRPNFESRTKVVYENITEQGTSHLKFEFRNERLNSIEVLFALDGD
jgi:hypothetical protein